MYFQMLNVVVVLDLKSSRMKMERWQSSQQQLLLYLLYFAFNIP